MVPGHFTSQGNLGSTRVSLTTPVVERQMEKMYLKIGGMSCGGCVNSVRNALSQVPGVEVRQVEVGSATLSYDPRISAAETIRSALMRAGFEPQDTTMSGDRS